MVSLMRREKIVSSDSPNINFQSIKTFPLCNDCSQKVSIKFLEVDSRYSIEVILCSIAA